ncbi:hypothetical protein JCM18905_1231 [Vibrio sp. JCM 18905]|nr:hypothetical protein JCM18905_1231 [Vibrio sp. JCM 18905]
MGFNNFFCELFEKDTSIVDVGKSINLALMAKKGFNSVAIGDVACKNKDNATTSVFYSEWADLAS